MTTLVLEKDPAVVQVGFSAHDLITELADGRRLLVPLNWYPRLLNASKAERLNWKLLGDGYAIEWPDLDEHIGVEGLLAGHPSGESAHSLNRWLASRSPQQKKKASALPKRPRKKEKKS